MSVSTNSVSHTLLLTVVAAQASRFPFRSVPCLSMSLFASGRSYLCCPFCFFLLLCMGDSSGVPSIDDTDLIVPIAQSISSWSAAALHFFPNVQIIVVLNLFSGKTFYFLPIMFLAYGKEPCFLLLFLPTYMDTTLCFLAYEASVNQCFP